jgi:ubiquinol-cytochrome c reductase cytochrome c1 subunit
MRKLSVLSLAAAFAISASVAFAAGEGGTITKRDWSFSGPFGSFDQASLQRGFQVYREICASCHGLKYIAFRNLADLGYNKGEIEAIAAEYEIMDGPNDEGEMFLRPGIPADRFPEPFANENEARAANSGAYPPDLTLMVKARPDGANYLYSLLTAYKDAPPEINVPDSMHYNEIYSGYMIAMPQPFYGDDVTYADGSDASVEALSADITAFLAWTSEPELESRKRIGIVVMIFLIVMCYMSYGAMRYVWSDVKKS